MKNALIAMELPLNKSKRPSNEMKHPLNQLKKNIYIYIYMIEYMCVCVIVISPYEHDIQIIAHDQGKAKFVAMTWIMRVNRDIANFYPMQIDY